MQRSPPTNERYTEFWGQPPVANESGPMYTNSGEKLAHIFDGTSNTFIVGEVDREHDDPFTTDYPSYCDPTCFIGSIWTAHNHITTFYGINSGTDLQTGGVDCHHPGGAHFLFVDGHVEFVSESTDQDVLIALTTREGGEAISDRP
jgi:prepilin-type processing-associated H-X9-DG protein